ncbi:MAG: hypothetical protein CVU40_15710 [Chloroflexi bacterium HGW-Chloroflexi-2]|nr:MAG: hypothetical protein CVU40_15710 [Chloroflexi bacterium HGW-Chloroflexi-2]
MDIILKPNEFGSTTPKPVSTGLKPPACDFNHRCQNTTSMVTIHSIRKYTHPKPEPSSTRTFIQPTPRIEIRVCYSQTE